MKPLAFDAIAEKRRYGSVIGGFSDVSFDRSDFENLDHASEAIGVFQIGDDWIPISRDELLTGLTRLIAYDSAYDTLVVPEKIASQFAQEFEGLFEKKRTVLQELRKRIRCFGAIFAWLFNTVNGCDF